MTWDIVTARSRAGLVVGDTSQDAILTASMSATLGLIEDYCDRFFLHQRETVRFNHTGTSQIQLKRYPLDTIHSITPTHRHKVDNAGGWIEFHQYVFEEELTIDFEGGYVTLPAQLELAFWGVFDSVYTAQTSSGGGGGVSGGVKKLAITGVGSIDYDTGSSASSSSGGSGAWGGAIPPMAMAILNLYRRESC